MGVENKGSKEEALDYLTKVTDLLDSIPLDAFLEIIDIRSDFEWLCGSLKDLKDDLYVETYPEEFEDC